MNLFVLFTHLIFTLPLFCIIEYFDKKEISIIQKILIPVIYIIVLAGLCAEIKHNIYMVVIFEVILHNFYINNIVNKDIIIDKKEYYINSIISIILAIFIYDYFISEVDDILPLANEFRGILWFLIIIFTYDLLKNNIVKIDSDKKSKFIERKREYVVVMYAKFKNKYFKLIKSKEELINRLVYSIMIYENYHNPLIYRKINNFKNKFRNADKKYGIMQVVSNHEIDDEKSIKLVIGQLEKNYAKITKKGREDSTIITLLDGRYSEETINDILDIYYEIMDFEKK